MDALSDVLRVIRLSGGVYLESELSAPWCIGGKLAAEDCAAYQVTPRHIIATHFVAAGRMWLRVRDEQPIQVQAGEMVLLPHNDPHVFGSEITSTPFPARDVIAPPPPGGIAQFKYGGGGEVTQLLCGFLGADQSFAPWLSSLPSVLKLDLRATPLGTWIESSFRFAVAQIAARRVGSAMAIAKLSELLFVEAVNQYVAGLSEDRRGWLAGLRDPHISRALTLMHADPAKAWSADALAAEVGMSRSGFAERFTTLVGQPPMQYLTSWRLRLASLRLRESRDTLAKVAFAAGYESEAAFSKAFKREFGESPAAWRRRTE